MKDTMLSDIASFNKFIKNISLITYSKVLIASGIFLLLSPLMINAKLFFLLGLVYFFSLVFLTSFSQAVLYSGPVLFLVNAGQNFSFALIPASEITNPLYWSGIQLIFIFSPYVLILSSAALILPLMWIKKINLFFYEKMLIASYILFAFVSIWIASNSLVSLVFLWEEFLIIIWFLYLLLIISQKKKSELKKIFTTLGFVFVLLVLFDAMIVGGQFLFKSSLGLLIEKRDVVPAFGAGADELPGIFRPFGLHFHANELAYIIIILGNCAVLLLHYFDNAVSKTKNIVITLTILTVILVTITTLSRAGFLAILFGTIYLVLRHKQLALTTVKQINETVTRTSGLMKLAVILTGLTLTIRLIPRIISSSFVLSQSGGLTTRADQLSEAFEVFMNYPLFGVGKSMFIPTSFQLFPSGIMKNFPEEIHNGFMLFLAERGIFAFGIYILIMLLIILNINKHIQRKVSRSLIYAGIIASYTIMLLHPFINIINLQILLALSLIHYEKK